MTSQGVNKLDSRQTKGSELCGKVGQRSR